MSPAVNNMPNLSDEQLGCVFESFPLGVLLTDSGGKIKQLNSELEKQFGYSREELLDQPIETLLPESSQDAHPFFFKSYVIKPEKRSMGYGRELFGRRKNGSLFPVEIGLNPLGTSDGQVIIATVSDISYRRRLENNYKKIIAAAPFGMVIVNSKGKITLTNDILNQLLGYSTGELLGHNLESLLPQRYRSDHIGLREAYSQDPKARAMGPERDLTGLHKNGTEFTHGKC